MAKVRCTLEASVITCGSRPHAMTGMPVCLTEVHLTLYTSPWVACPWYELCALPREEQQQPVFMAIDALDFPELHDESIPHMAFLKNCTRLLASAGVRDFNMQVHPLPYLFLCATHFASFF